MAAEVKGTLHAVLRHPPWTFWHTTFQWVTQASGEEMGVVCRTQQLHFVHSFAAGEYVEMKHVSDSSKLHTLRSGVLEIGSGPGS